MIDLNMLGLKAFETHDRFSLEGMNNNFKAIDGYLAQHGRDITKRIKFASGSYVGQTANQEDAYWDNAGKKLTTGFGLPVSSAADKIAAQVDFDPKVFFLSASRTAAYAWTANVEGTPSLTGQERQSFCLLATAGMMLCPFFFSQRGPAIVTNGGGLPDGGSWSERSVMEQSKVPVRVNAPLVYDSSGLWLMDAAQVVTTENSGVFTITVKGASKSLGTENLADIQGMTYHWVALG